MKHLLTIATCLVLTLIVLPKAQGQNKGAGRGSPAFDFRKKSQSKEGTRWTLQEWLAQKDRNHLMDLWLGMYAPSPYEFFISGQMQSYDRTTSTIPGANAAATAEVKNSFRSYSGSIAAYATVIGLQGEYENNTEETYTDTSGSLNLRILGNAVQGTHLIINYGQRTRDLIVNGTPLNLKQQFAGGELDLYVTKYFGLHGSYRSFVPMTDSTLGEVTGNKSEAGAFIDFEALRIFGNWYSDKQDAVLAGSTDRTIRTGIQSGIKFFF